MYLIRIYDGMSYIGAIRQVQSNLSKRVSNFTVLYNVEKNDLMQDAEIIVTASYIYILII